VHCTNASISDFSKLKIRPLQSPQMKKLVHGAPFRALSLCKEESQMVTEVEVEVKEIPKNQEKKTPSYWSKDGLVFFTSGYG